MIEFRRTIGQEGAKKLLLSIWEKVYKNELPTIMFFGPEGVGKATLSLEFAQSLVCPRENKPCYECYNCRRFAELKSPDIILISGVEPQPYKLRPEEYYEEAKSIKISQIRNMQQEIQKPPFEMPLRVVIIMNIEDANLESQNALLKVLEEGSKKTVFILISSRPNFVVPTILSRSFKVRFSSMRYEEFSMIVNTDDRLLYELSEGSPGVCKGFIKMGDELYKSLEIWESIIYFDDRTKIEEALNLFERWKNYFLKIGYYVLKRYLYDTEDFDKFSRFINSFRHVEIGYRRNTFARALYISSLWNPKFSVI